MNDSGRSEMTGSNLIATSADTRTDVKRKHETDHRVNPTLAQQIRNRGSIDNVTSSMIEEEDPQEKSPQFRRLMRQRLRTSRIRYTQNNMSSSAGDVAIHLHQEDFHDNLRRDLDIAIAAVYDRDILRERLTAFENSPDFEPPADQPLARHARRVLHERAVDELRSRLRHALTSRDIDDMRAAIAQFDRERGTNLNEARLDARFRQSVEKARELLTRLERVERARHAVAQCGAAAVSELRSYATAPKFAMLVMQATFLLLGEDERNLSSWQNVKKLAGKMGHKSLKQRVATRALVDIKMSTVNRVSEIVSQTSMEEVTTKSHPLSCFYGWCLTVLDEIEKRSGSADKDYDVTLTPTKPSYANSPSHQNKISSSLSPRWKSGEGGKTSSQNTSGFFENSSTNSSSLAVQPFS